MCIRDRTYFEALASGLPVLCRRDPCLEGVIEDGINGWQYAVSYTHLATLTLSGENYQGGFFGLIFTQEDGQPGSCHFTFRLEKVG